MSQILRLDNADAEDEEQIQVRLIDRMAIRLVPNSQHTDWSEGFLYKVVPPELQNSPIMYFVIHNSVVLSKILKIVVPF